MKTSYIAILVLVLLAIGGVMVYAAHRTSSAPPTVSTLPPQNDAATGTVTSSTTTQTTTPTPTQTPPSAKTGDTAALSERILDNDVYITPLSVVSDSRCPMGVYCIQAGDIVITATLQDATHTETITMHQGSPVAFGNKHVTLMSATPPKSQQGTIAPSDYRFTFSVTFGMGGEGS